MLQLMTFGLDGCPLAAVLTTSLPHCTVNCVLQLGLPVHVDPRLAASLLYAFLKLGFKEEAAELHAVDQPALRGEQSSRTARLQIMYGLHGEHKLEEKHLSHLDGYKSSAARAHRQRRVRSRCSWTSTAS